MPVELKIIDIIFNWRPFELKIIDVFFNWMTIELKIVDIIFNWRPFELKINASFFNLRSGQLNQYHLIFKQVRLFIIINLDPVAIGVAEIELFYPVYAVGDGILLPCPILVFNIVFF